jgi:hypothetical protein
MAFAVTLDAFFAIKYDLESMLGQRIPLLILTDSADAMTKLSSNNALHCLLETNKIQHPVEKYIVDLLPHKGHHSLPIRPLRFATEPNQI